MLVAGTEAWTASTLGTFAVQVIDDQPLSGS